MTRSPLTTLALAGALAATAAPAVAAPTTQDRTNAAQECRAERGTTAATLEAFAQRYGTKGSNYKNAFGKCVSQRSADEEQERKQARTSASSLCRAEQGETDATRAAFAAKYGKNANDKNAFGKCVSTTAKAEERKADEQDAEQRAERRNAARTCATERGTTDSTRAAFAMKYGTKGSNYKNAFGRCVSQTAQAQQAS